jgi:hypothetical protein
MGYGELAERHSDTIRDEMVARSVQVSALKQLNDPAKLAAVTARRDQANQTMTDNVRINAPVTPGLPQKLSDFS